MSKSVVTKYCSILNYLKHNHEELYELIQDLCIGRIFNPRKGSNGVTFLCPDEALTKELKKMASGSDPERAVEAIQSVVIPDHLPNLSDFEGVLPTNVRGKTVNVESSGAKVELAGGASVSLDKDWSSRKDRTNLAVHKLSGAFPKLSEGSVEPKKRAKTGGASMAGLARAALFESVLRECCKPTKRDPAMELLVSLVQFLEESKQNNELHLVCSQLSGDTLASLAIVLQPYKQAGHYLSNDVITQFVAAYHNPAFATFCYVSNPVEIYNNCMKKCAKESDDTKTVLKLQIDLYNRMNKLSAVNMINSTYGSLRKQFATLRGVDVPSSQLYAEAELRVLCAIKKSQSVEQPCLDYDEFSPLFKNCNLDVPHVLGDQKIISQASVAVYYSSVYLIARSDAFFYYPGMIDGSVFTEDTEAVVSNENLICLAPKELKLSEEVYKKLFARFRSN